jgi:hypothetical protein
METVSDNKGKRGRPRKYDYKELEEIAEVVGARAKTIRGRQDMHHAVQAYQILQGTLEQGGLPEAQRAKLRNLLDNMRPSVAAELGRFVGEDSDEEIMKFWQAAHFLMDHPELPAKRAIRMLRRVRLGGGGDEYTGVALVDALCTVIDQYLERYPELGRESIEVALQMTREAYEHIPMSSEAASEKVMPGPR